jgi:hypothetical protein
MKLFQKQEQDKQRAMDMLQGSFDMQLAVLRNLQASVLAYAMLRPGLRCCRELSTKDSRRPAGRGC